MPNTDYIWPEQGGMSEKWSGEELLTTPEEGVKVRERSKHL